MRASVARRVRADEAKQRRKTQCAEDETDETAEQPDQHSAQDRGSCADPPRAGVPRAGLRAKEIDAEDEKRHTDHDEQIVSPDDTRQETSDYGPENGRRRQPGEPAPRD